MKFEKGVLKPAYPVTLQGKSWRSLLLRLLDTKLINKTRKRWRRQKGYGALSRPQEVDGTLIGKNGLAESVEQY